MFWPQLPHAFWGFPKIGIRSSLFYDSSMNALRSPNTRRSWLMSLSRAVAAVAHASVSPSAAGCVERLAVQRQLLRPAQQVVVQVEHPGHLLVGHPDSGEITASR